MERRLTDYILLKSLFNRVSISASGRSAKFLIAVANEQLLTNPYPEILGLCSAKTQLMLQGALIKGQKLFNIITTFQNHYSKAEMKKQIKTQGGEIVTRDLLKRARAGENVLDEVLKEILPEQSEEIKKAIADKVPILIFDNVEDGTDPLLYHALKNAGAISVPNYRLMSENGEMESNCVYLTVFINEKSKEDLHYC